MWERTVSWIIWSIFASALFINVKLQEKRFHNWLENARDWAVSRSRFWGTPLPVWVSEDGEEILVMDSIEKLEQLSGVKVSLFIYQLLLSENIVAVGWVNHLLWVLFLFIELFACMEFFSSPHKNLIILNDGWFRATATFLNEKLNLQGYLVFFEKLNLLP